MSDASDFRRIARDALSGRWLLAISTGFIAILLGADSRGGTSSHGDGSNSNYSISIDVLDFYVSTTLFILSILLVWALITFFIGGAIELGYCRFNMNLIRGTNPKFSDIFSRLNYFGKALGLRIMITILIFLWSLLFVIPGIIALYRYSMAFYIMEEDPSIGIMDAIAESKQLMIGNKFRLFCLSFSFIGWAILSLLTFGIGFLWLIPYTNASYAAFYLEISDGDKAYF